MLQVRRSAPVSRLEHGVQLEGKSAVGQKPRAGSWAVRGEVLPLGFAAAICVGVLVYLQLPFEPCVMVLVFAALLGTAFLVVSRLPGLSAGARWGALILFGVTLGFSAAKARTLSVAGPSILEPMGPIMVEGWITSIEPASKGVRLRLKPHAIAGLHAEALPKEIRVTHRLNLEVSSGRFVRCWAVLRPPPGPAVPGDYDFRRQAWFEGLGAVGYVQGRCRGGVLGAPPDILARFDLWVGTQRRQLANFTRQAAGVRAGGFAAALVSGDRSFMSQTDQEALRASGLAHLLAISGLHLGIVGGLVYLIVRRGLALVEPFSLRYPVQKFASFAALIAITVYLAISGASVSTQRAFIMSAVFFLAILLDRPALSLRSFSIALMAVTLIRPESVVSPGFQMSFAATGVLITIYEAWSRSRARVFKSGVFARIRTGAVSLAVTSVAASAATAPFAFFHFQRLAPLGLFANLAAMPIVSLIAVPAAGLSIVLAPFGLSEAGLRLFGLSLELVLGIAHKAADAGDAVAHPIKAMPVLALMGFTATLTAFVALRGWCRILCVCSLSAISAGIWVMTQPAAAYWSPSGEVYLRQSSGQYHKIPFLEADELGPLRLNTALPVMGCSALRCEYALGLDETILLVKQDKDANCIDIASYTLVLAGPGAAHLEVCANALAWSEILTRGGTKINISPGGYNVSYPPACGRRPWRPCSPSRIYE